jgi:hypothetical protein
VANRLIGDARLLDPEYVPAESPVGEEIAAGRSRKPKFAGKLTNSPPGIERAN